MSDLLLDNREKIAELCRVYGVRRLEVFGSAATGTFDEERSDIDLIVDFADETPGLARRFVALAEELEALFGRKVDVLVDKSFRNPYFRASVNRSRTVVYAETNSEAPT